MRQFTRRNTTRRNKTKQNKKRRTLVGGTLKTLREMSILQKQQELENLLRIPNPNEIELAKIHSLLDYITNKEQTTSSIKYVHPAPKTPSIKNSATPKTIKNSVKPGPVKSTPKTAPKTIKNSVKPEPVLKTVPSLPSIKPKTVLPSINKPEVVVHKTVPVPSTITKICRNCTFENNILLSNCEMCGNPLLSDCSDLYLSSHAQILKQFFNDYEEDIIIKTLQKLCAEKTQDRSFIDFLQTQEISQPFLNVFEPEYESQSKLPVEQIRQPFSASDTQYNSGQINGTTKGIVLNKCWVISLAHMYKVKPHLLYNMFIEKMGPNNEPKVFKNLKSKEIDTDAIEFLQQFNVPLPNGLIIISVRNGDFNNNNLLRDAYHIEPLSVNTPVIVNFGNYHFQYGKPDRVAIRKVRDYVIRNKTYINNLQNDIIDKTIKISQEEIDQCK
jgi:hypothetical protein